MASPHLTQAEADALLAVNKQRIDDKQWDYPDLGGRVMVPLISVDKREQFSLDRQRGRVALTKGTYQNRGRQNVILARLDFGGAPHRNPDGEEVGSPHLHLYREGYGDKWAYPVPIDRFADVEDAWRLLEDFLSYCNIVEPPAIVKGVFT